MTEAMQESTLGETQEESTLVDTGATDLYERLRDSAPKDARVEWRDGDRWASSIREKFQELAADGDLSEQGKFERAQRHLESATQKIERGYEKAAKYLEKEAQRKALASVPLPDGHDLNTKVKDNAGLLAIQGEAQAIISKIERMREKLPKTMRAAGDHAMDVLREAYASAMEDGGVEGMARARGALKAAEQLGAPVDGVVAPWMERQHYEAADEARRLQYLAKHVPSARAMIPANPFSPEGKPKGEYHTSGARGSNLFAPRSTTTHKGAAQKGEGRRRPWK